MQTDTYTKVVLTVIAIGVGLLVVDQKPVKDAHAAGSLKIDERVFFRQRNFSLAWLEFTQAGNGKFLRSCRKRFADKVEGDLSKGIKTWFGCDQWAKYDKP